jgi:hypothetical protein
MRFMYSLNSISSKFHEQIVRETDNSLAQFLFLEKIRSIRQITQSGRLSLLTKKTIVILQTDLKRSIIEFY